MKRVGRSALDATLLVSVVALSLVLWVLLIKSGSLVAKSESQRVSRVQLLRTDSRDLQRRVDMLSHRLEGQPFESHRKGRTGSLSAKGLLERLEMAMLELTEMVELRPQLFLPDASEGAVGQMDLIDVLYSLKYYSTLAANRTAPMKMRAAALYSIAQLPHAEAHMDSRYVQDWLTMMSSAGDENAEWYLVRAWRDREGSDAVTAALCDTALYSRFSTVRDQAINSLQHSADSDLVREVVVEARQDPSKEVRLRAEEFIRRYYQ